jgi:hypothetical protein
MAITTDSGTDFSDIDASDGGDMSEITDTGITTTDFGEEIIQTFPTWEMEYFNSNKEL